MATEAEAGAVAVVEGESAERRVLIKKNSFKYVLDVKYLKKIVLLDGYVEV